MGIKDRERLLEYIIFLEEYLVGNEERNSAFYIDYLKKLPRLVELVNGFIDNVCINDEDKKVKIDNHVLLQRTHVLFNYVGNFSGLKDSLKKTKARNRDVLKQMVRTEVL